MTIHLNQLYRLIRTSGMALAALFLLMLIALPARAVDESNLLPVDQAFVLSAKAVGHDRIEINWNIAKGYYLYRGRMSAAPANGATQTGPLQLPEGIHKHDPFFGEVQIFHGRVTGTLALSAAPTADAVAIDVKYQGCADAGVCYPPQKRTLHIALAAATDAATTNAVVSNNNNSSGSDGLAALVGSNRATVPGTDSLPLPAEQAFGFEAIVESPNSLLLRFTPAKGYYLYRDKTHFRIDSDGALVLPGKPQWPVAKPFHDEHFGDVAVYTDQVEVPLPLQRANAAEQKITVQASFQGCQNDGVCYPPMQRTITLDLPAGGTISSDATAIQSLPPGIHRPADASSLGSLLTAILLALGGGLILNLMPCVLPVLSLKALSLVQSGESHAHARRHAFWYTGGVLVSFAALGALVLGLRQAGLALGWGFQLQQPLVVAALAYLMLAIGLSLSGVFQFGAGAAGMGQKLTEKSGPAGDFFTGVLAVVVASPCTAPFMGSALVFAFSAPIAVAMAIFLALGLGLALPFLLIAFIPALASRLPKPGAWMETLKQFLAFPMYLTVAWLVSVLAAQSGSSGVLYLLGGAVVLAFGLWWWERGRYSRHRIVRPLAWLVLLAALLPLIAIYRLPPVAKQVTETGTVAYSASKLAELRAAHRVVFIDMTADWCVSCKANEAAVLSRPAFKNAMKSANAVYMIGDYTSVDPSITAFLDAHHAVGVPLYVVYPRSGGEGDELPNILTPNIVGEALERATKQ